MTEHTVQQLPADGQMSTTPEELDALTSHVMKARGNGPLPVTERLTFKVAAYLQAHPRKHLKIADVAASLDLTAMQVAGVLGSFAIQRTDVVRIKRGVYAYYPNRGPGIKPPASKEVSTVVVPAAPVVPPVIPAVTYTEIPGIVTSAGHRVVCDEHGVIFALLDI